MSPKWTPRCHRNRFQNVTPQGCPKGALPSRDFQKRSAFRLGFVHFCFAIRDFVGDPKKNSKFDAQMVSKSFPKRVPKGVSKRALQNPDKQKNNVSLRFRTFFCVLGFCKVSENRHFGYLFGTHFGHSLGSFLGAF